MSEEESQQQRSESTEKQVLIDANDENSVAEAPQVKMIKIGKLSIDAALIALCCMNFFLNAGVSIIVPFYPPIAVDVGCSRLTIGLVFAAHPVGSFAFSMFVAKFMSVIGRKNLMLWGLIIQAASIFAFGVLIHIPDKTTFIVISLISRFFQGISRSAYGSTTFAYVPLLWPNDIPKKISQMETWTGLGLMMGPPMGAAMKAMTGGSYEIPFYFLAGLFSVFIYPTLQLLPPDVPVNQKNKATLSLGKVLGNGKVFFNFMLIIFASAGLTWINPNFSVHMATYGIDDSMSALIYTIGTVTYIGSLAVIPALIKKFDKQFILSMALVLGIFSDEIMGPEPYLGLPQHFSMQIIGLFICGAAQGAAILPFIPNMIEIINPLYPLHKEFVGDMAAGLFMAGYSGGALFGPVLGGVIFDAMQSHKLNSLHCETQDCKNDAEHFAYLNCSRTFALCQFVVLILYLLFANGWASWVKVCACKSKKKQYADTVIDENTHVEGPNQTPITNKKDGLSQMLLSDTEYNGGHQNSDSEYDNKHNRLNNTNSRNNDSEYD